MRLNFVAQQGHGVAHVVKQHRVVLDHQLQAHIRRHRRTQCTQTIKVGAAQIEQTQ